MGFVRLVQVKLLLSYKPRRSVEQVFDIERVFVYRGLSYGMVKRAEDMVGT